VKKLIFILFIFILPNTSFANDLEDFQIEGMSLGESLLKHFTKKDIEAEIKSEWSYKYKRGQYISLGIGDKTGFSMRKVIKNYDRLSVTVQGGDKKYIIQAIAGVIDCEDDINICNSNKKQIVSDLESFFENNLENIDEDVQFHQADKNNESKVISTYFKFKNKKYDNVAVEIYDWSERLGREQKWSDNLKVSIQSDKFIRFLMKEGADPI